MGEFAHLHVHTEYSLLDGAARINRLLKACKAKDMSAVAITDHGVMYGVIQFIMEAKNQGIKPIIGCEFYTTDDMHDKKGVKNGEYNHLVLLAKNDIGYKNLVKLDSMAFTEGFYYKPRIDYKLLAQHTEGVICLSACLGGSIPQKILARDYDGALEEAKLLKSMFAEGDFYIELQDQGLPEQRAVNLELIRIAEEIGVKIVATNDVHYIEKEDSEMHEVLLCMQTQSTMDNPSRFKFDSDQYYLKDYDEMYELFSAYPEALSNTMEIVDKCNVNIKFGEYLIPRYIPENGQTPYDFICGLTERGLKQKYKEITPEIRERADYELGVISKLGYVEYYLIVWDFINYAREHGIPVGPGRGSGVGSIVAYATGITDVDPLKYSLFFERFLNMERVSMPDFDVDFCCDRRGEVIEYVTRKYGSAQVSQIITFGCLKAKAAIKDVGRVYNVPFAEMNKITKLMPNAPKLKISDVLGRSEKQDPQLIVRELIEMYENDDTVRRVLDMAIKVEGMPKNCSKHAAGVVICKDPISDHVPLSLSSGDVTTQFNMTEIEKLGLLKMDFLGLITLTDIKKACDYVKESHGVTVDFRELGYEDPKVYELIASGDNVAVFQLESGGMSKFMSQLKPTKLEEIIAGISLFRPGPMDSIPKYLENKNNPDKITYDHELLVPILDVTYGCIVYQEQVMKIVQSLAGYSLGMADNVRRMMSKKKHEEMAKEKDRFLNGVYDKDGNCIAAGAIKTGVPQDVAEKIYADMAAFASYAFNKSHAAAYAVLAYQTAYLKRYYPVEFMTAILNNRITHADELSHYSTYMREKNIEILPPDVNKSFPEFRVENGKVRFGLSGIKGVGIAAMENMLEERKRGGEFKSLEDFTMRVDKSVLNKRLLENLIKGGAMDCFGKPRSVLMSVYEKAVDLSVKSKQDQAIGQFSFFADLDDTLTIEYPVLDEYPENEKLRMEKEVLGLYISGHPLNEYVNEFKNLDFNTSMIVKSDDEDDENQENAQTEDKKQVKTGGILNSVTKKITKTGNEMCIAKLEDFYGSIEIVMFGKTYEKYKNIVQDDAIVKIDGELTYRDGEAPSITVRAVYPWTPPKKGEAVEKASTHTDKRLCIRIENDFDDVFREVSKILADNPGKIPVFVQSGGKLMKVNRCVEDGKALYWALEDLVGDSNFKFIEKN